MDSLPQGHLNALSISFAAKQSAMASRTVETLGCVGRRLQTVVRPKEVDAVLVLSNFGSGIGGQPLDADREKYDAFNRVV